MRLTPCEWKAIHMICQRENIKRKKLFELVDKSKGFLIDCLEK
jgi:hypothetical protein